jgi:hypothetical protein
VTGETVLFRSTEVQPGQGVQEFKSPSYHGFAYPLSNLRKDLIEILDGS